MSGLKLFSANEFSPGVVDLSDCLNIAKQYEGNSDAFSEALRLQYFSQSAKKKTDSKARLVEQKKLAMNLRNGLKNYGLFDNESVALTDFGEQLLQLNDDKLYQAFATHILKNLFGLEMLKVIEEMQERGEAVNKKSLASKLSEAGFTAQKGGEIPLSTTDHLRMLGWLRKANVLPPKGYTINNTVVSKLVGFSNKQLDEILDLTPEQRAFIETFWTVAIADPKGEFFTKDILSICRNQHGSILDSIADRLAEKVFCPLEKLGYFSIIDRGKGRGGKSGKIVASKKLLALKPDVFQVRGITNLPADLRNRLNITMEQLWKDLGNNDKHIKGLALEVLAYRIATLLGLSLAKFRLRGPQSTNGAEVDLVCDGVNLHYSRWVVQCKNTPRSTLPLSVLAKEIGMAYLLKAHVILLITTGEFGETLQFHADGLAENSHLQVVLIDKNVLAEFQEKGISFLLSHFKKTAKDIMKIKKKQLIDE